MGILDYLHHFRPHTSSVRIDEIISDIVHDLVRVDRQYSKDRKKYDIRGEINDLEKQHKLIGHLNYWINVRLVKIADGLKITQREINRERQREEKQRRRDNREKERLLKMKAQLKYNEIKKLEEGQREEMERLRRQIQEGMRLIEEDKRHIEMIKRQLNADNREINEFRKKMAKARHRDIIDLNHIRKNC